MKNGAVGGKLVGAGGGGFLMFYAADRNKLRHAMSKAGLEEVRFRFDFEGTKVVLSADACRWPFWQVVWPPDCAPLPKQFPSRWSMWRASLLSFASWIICGSRGLPAWCCASAIWVSRLRRWWAMALLLAWRCCYSWDGPRLLGTGGALRQALPLLGEQFFVFYGDSYLPIDFQAVERGFLESGKPALMTVLQNDDQWDKSNVLFQDGCIVEYNKRRPDRKWRTLTTGLGCCLPRFWRDAPADEPFDLADMYHELSVQGDCWPAMKCLNGFMKLAHIRGWKKPSIISKRRGGMSYAQQHLMRRSISSRK